MTVKELIEKLKPFEDNVNKIELYVDDCKFECPECDADFLASPCLRTLEIKRIFDTIQFKLGQA